MGCGHSNIIEVVETETVQTKAPIPKEETPPPEKKKEVSFNAYRRVSLKSVRSIKKGKTLLKDRPTLIEDLELEVSYRKIQSSQSKSQNNNIGDMVQESDEILKRKTIKIKTTGNEDQQLSKRGERELIACEEIKGSRLNTSRKYSEEIKESKENRENTNTNIELIPSSSMNAKNANKRVSLNSVKSIISINNIVQNNFSTNADNTRLLGTNIFEGLGKKKIDIKSIVNKKKNKNMSILDNLEMKSLNYSASRIKKYYLNQLPLTSMSFKQGEKFSDPLFPAGNNSILGKDPNNKTIDMSHSRYKKNLSKLQVHVDEIVWLRPEEFFPGGKYTIFEGSIDIDDVNQGNLGNCYFLSAVAAMCEYPQMISEVFRQFSVSEKGYYEVIFNINGQWEVVIVDDYFPCFKSNKNPIFSKPKNSELWVLLLEKAWAKVNGGYVNIIGGWPCEVLKTLTPFCIKSYVNKDYEPDLFSIIHEADQKGYIMACSSIFEASIERKGLISGHAFTIISAHEAEIRGKTIRLLRIRNPWGYQEWNGPWSDGSPEWDEEAKQAFGEYIDQDDGTFFILYKDYIENFLETQICRVISPSCTRSIEISEDRLFVGNVYEMLINRHSLVDISVIRKTYRFHRSIPEVTEMSINVIIAKKTEENFLEVLRIECENENDLVLDVELTPGNYFIYILCNKESYINDKTRSIRLYIVADNYYLLSEKGEDTNFDLLKYMIKGKCRSLPVVNSEITLTKNKISDRTTLGIFYLRNCSGNPKTYRIRNDVKNFTLLNGMVGEEAPQESNDLHLMNSIKNSVNTKKSIKVLDKGTTLDSIKKKRLKTIGFRSSDPMYEEDSKNKITETKSSENFLVKLGSEEDFLLIGQRNQFYDEYSFNVTYEEASKKDLLTLAYYSGRNKDDYLIGGGLITLNRTNKADLNTTNLAMSLISKSQMDEEFLVRPNLDSYDYFFKRHDIDVNNQIAVKLDDNDISVEYFTVKYPQFMSILLKLEPLPNTEVRFMDIFDSGYGVYFGEWMFSSTSNSIPVKHGRGLSVFEDKSKHVGYYKNDEFHGEGQFIYADGSKIIILFVDGKMHGQGIKIKNGVEKKVVYEDGYMVNN